ncbi:cysteine synthase A, partial [Pseudomonas syringae pv. pisi str. 1704B]
GAVEPDGSPIITQAMAGETITPSQHKIQGIGDGDQMTAIIIAVISVFA